MQRAAADKLSLCLSKKNRPYFFSRISNHSLPAAFLLRNSSSWILSSFVYSHGIIIFRVRCVLIFAMMIKKSTFFKLRRVQRAAADKLSLCLSKKRVAAADVISLQLSPSRSLSLPPPFYLRLLSSFLGRHFSFFRY